jgi:hypothetical protein
MWRGGIPTWPIPPDYGLVRKESTCISSLNFYIQAIQVHLFTKMLQQGQTLRRERKSFKLLNEKLFNYWDKFNEHHLTTEQLLEKVAEMYTNFNAIKYAKNVNDSRSVELEH